jgi:hypothetical protein
MKTPSTVQRAFQPIAAVGDRPRDPAGAQYVQFYLVFRLLIGALGAALPFILVLVDGLWLRSDGEPFPRSAISPYYYSGMRDVYVAIICATGIFLIGYRVAEVNLDNTLSVLAGVFALGVALFPPELPPGVAPGPLQNRLGEGLTKWSHFVSACVFLTALAALSYLFGDREFKRPRRRTRRSRRFWGAYHWLLAGVIVVSLIAMGLTQLLAVGPRNTLLYGETACLVAFGASWFWKGAEWDMLRGNPVPPVAPPAPPSPPSVPPA